MRPFLFLLVLLASACVSPAQRFVKTVNSWADLLSLNPNDVHTNAFVVYGTSVGDEQGGIFTYFSNSSETTNLQTVFKPYSYNGRWIKQAGNFLTNTYVTNLYASNIFTTNLTVVNLISNYVTTNITLETLYVTNLFATNATFYTTNVTVVGRRVTMYDFDPNQFSVAPAGHPAVYDVAIKSGATTTNFESFNRLLARNTFAMGANVSSQGATAATNAITTADSSWVDIQSNSAVPGARVIELDTGTYNGQMLVLRNLPGGETILLPNSSAVTGGGQVNLAGTDWQAKPSEAILLIYDEAFQDWNEIGRFGSGTTAGVVANLTQGYIPYATSTNTLGDSPLYRHDSQTLGLGTLASTVRFLVNRGVTLQIGSNAGTNSVPSFSTLVGSGAGRAAASIGESALFGHNVAYQSTNIYGSTGLGPQAFLGSAYRSNDVAIGFQAFQAVGLSISNVAIGTAKTVPIYTNPVANVFVGAGIGGVGNETNAIVIGAHAVGGGPNVAVIGNTNVASLYIGKVGKVDSSGNVAFGTDALKANTNIWNIAIGNNALDSSTLAKWNIAIGENALTSVATSDVRGNIAIGDSAMDAKTSGQWDTAIGHNALGALVTSGGAYTVVGASAAVLTTASLPSTVVGYSALSKNTSGYYNTVVGQQAAENQTTANFNDVFGAFSGQNNVAGGNNTLLGAYAFHLTTNISKTVVLGQQLQSNALAAGDVMTNNIVNSVFIGYKDTSITNNVPGLTNVVSIGYNTIPTNNNEIVIGNSSHTKAIFPITSFSGAGTKYLSDDGQYRAAYSVLTGNYTDWDYFIPTNYHSGNLLTGDTTVLTVPAGKRLLITAIQAGTTNMSGVYLYPQILTNSVYHRAFGGQTVTTNAIGGLMLFGFPMLLTENESLAINASADGGNVWAHGYLMSTNSPLKPIRAFNIGIGANTVYTVPTGYYAAAPFNSGVSTFPTGIQGLIVNDSGGSRAITEYVVPSGSSADGTTIVFNRSLSDGNSTTFGGFSLSEGGSIVISSDSAAAGQHVWGAVVEVPVP